MIHTKLTPDPECHDCGGSGCVRASMDCECLLREAKVSLWRRAVDLLVGPAPKGRSMVAGRRQFMQTLATGAVAAAAGPAVYGGAIGRFEDVRFLKTTSFYGQMAASSKLLGQDTAKALNEAAAIHTAHRNSMVWSFDAMYGSPVVRPEMGLRLMDTA